MRPSMAVACPFVTYGSDQRQACCQADAPARGHKLKATRFQRLLALAMLSVVAATGCALAPGSHLHHRSEALPLDALVDIQPITPGLVADHQLQVNGRAQPMPELLRTDIARFEYRVAPGDVLNVIVYEHPELTIPAGAERRPEDAGSQVRPDGTIFYPYVGRIDVGGKTLDEIRDVLTDGLGAYITEPQVDVAVAAYRSQKVHVSGAVSQPGVVPITAVPLTIADAISHVGGASPDANWHDVRLTRNGEEVPVSLYAMMREGDQSQNRLLRDGDVLHVPRAENRAISVLGQVVAPGSIPAGNEPLMLTDALARVGGAGRAFGRGLRYLCHPPAGTRTGACRHHLPAGRAQCRGVLAGYALPVAAR